MLTQPPSDLYTFKNFQKTPANIRLRTVAIRTFVGAVCTLASSIVNLSVLMALGGEPGWVCLMCCNSDILFSAVVIQWITYKDNAGTSNTITSRRAVNETFDDHKGPFSPHTAGAGKDPLDDVVEMSLSETVQSDRNQAGSSYGSEDDIVKEADSGADLTGKNPGPGAVVVTTTIKRESKPSRSLFDGDSEGISGAMRVHAGSRPMNVAAKGKPEGFMRQGARTKISAGAHH